MSEQPSLRFLYFVSLVASGCGFMTQTLVSGFWTTAFSQDTLHFSLNLAFYFLSLGVGSLLSTKIQKPVAAHLLTIATALCVWEALSISILRVAITSFGEIGLFPILVVSIAGTLTGLILPLTLRVGEGRKGLSLSLLFFCDYLAAIAFTMVFTFVLLIPLGYGRTALLVGLVGLVCLAFFVLANRDRWAVVTLFAAAMAPIPFHLFARDVGERFRDPKDQSTVLFSKQSHYQKLVFMEEKGEGSFFPGAPQHVLYLDGFVQFSSYDEQTYHVCIANIPQAAAESVGNPSKRALILGGGDGLAARNLLASPRIETIDLVELDPEMIDFAKTHPMMRSLNLDALGSHRVHVTVADAFQWVRGQHEPYDIVIIDFPHAKNLALARLFSAEFYSHVKRLVKPDGFISIQAGPSVDLSDKSLMSVAAPAASIRNTLRAIGFSADIYVSPRDEEAFVLGTPLPNFDMLAFSKKIGIVGLSGLGLICTYNSKWRIPAAEITTLNTLKISSYMYDWYRKANPTMFFNFRGQKSIFLPE